MNILVVDPDRALQEYYTHLLEAEFRDVTLSFRASAQEALEFIPAHAFDIVLTESRVGDMDLFEFIQKLKKLDLPCLVVSSDNSERLIVESILAGAVDFISKNNIKLGHLPYAIARALLGHERWLAARDAVAALPPRPEYEKIDRKVREFMRAERMELRRKALAEAPPRETVFIEGETYFIIYLYVQLQFPDSFRTNVDERRFLATQNRTLTRFAEIVPRYGGNVWTRKEDAIFFAFLGEDYSSALLAAIEIRASMKIFNLTMENLPEPIQVAQGIAAGQTVYKEDHSQIYCEALNLSAHLAIYGDMPNGLLLTSQVTEQLTPRARKYLFKSPAKFEGHQIYHFEEIA
ncbi:MAG: response regulator [Spirochaetales bacterium]|nr:response regulator [Leptospiraceae bacterium]MCB1326267.1 response regulator [Leptospiraceae bacterium]MCP5481082.1 response regulator [Spirochaetales bacterium]MCP5485462.1 response regulator [Spirochaetales bacterium]